MESVDDHAIDGVQWGRPCRHSLAPALDAVDCVIVKGCSADGPARKLVSNTMDEKAYIHHHFEGSVGTGATAGEIWPPSNLTEAAREGNSQ